jgi:hypothetical protein
MDGMIARLPQRTRDRGHIVFLKYPDRRNSSRSGVQT